MIVLLNVYYFTAFNDIYFFLKNNNLEVKINIRIYF